MFNVLCSILYAALREFKKNKQTNSCGLTTYRRNHRGPVLCRSGGSQRRGPWRSESLVLKLAIGILNVTSLMGKEPELVWEIERYRLEIVGLASTDSLDPGTSLLESGWTLFYDGVVPGVGLVIAPQFSGNMLEFTPLSKRVTSLPPVPSGLGTGPDCGLHLCTK